MRSVDRSIGAWHRYRRTVRRRRPGRPARRPGRRCVRARGRRRRRRRRPVAVAVARPADAVAQPDADPDPDATPDADAPVTRVGARPDCRSTRAGGTALPVAVMIDDARAARPQSGFNGASVVFQAPADGVRDALPHDLPGEGDSPTGRAGPQRPVLPRPVGRSRRRRSSRHYGGDRKSRRFIRRTSRSCSPTSTRSARARKAFHRIKTPPRAAQRLHLDQGAPQAGHASSAARPLMPARAPRPRVHRPVAAREPGAAKQTIRVPYHTNVITYRYDRASNLYRRSVDGRAQVDPADGKRVTATNVVVLFQKFRIDTKIEPGHARPVLKTTRQGQGLDLSARARVVKATWSKERDVAPTLLLRRGRQGDPARPRAGRSSRSSRPGPRSATAASSRAAATIPAQTGATDPAQSGARLPADLSTPSVSAPTRRGRSPYTAGFLSFLWPGLGQWYAGRNRTAALFALPVIGIALVLLLQAVGSVGQLASLLADPVVRAHRGHPHRPAGRLAPAGDRRRDVDRRRQGSAAPPADRPDLLGPGARRGPDARGDRLRGLGRL